MRIKKLFGGLVLTAIAVFAMTAPASAAEEEVRGLAEEECIEILETGGTIDACQTAPNPILPATNEMIWGGIAFIVLFLLLAKFGFPAIKAGMDARAQKIADDLAAAENAKTESESIQAEYQRQLADARAESGRIIEEARAQGEAVRRDIVARAEVEANELRQRNAEQVGAERDRVMGEMQGQVAALAIELAEKVVESNLDREANTRLIENYINTVGTTTR